MIVKKSIVLELSKRCNLNCAHCYVDYSKRSAKFTNKIEKVREILSFFSAEDYMFLTITGGEPFLDENIIKVLEYATKARYVITIKTNGTLFTEEIIKKIKHLKIYSVHISLYSHIENRHDSVTGVSGSYRLTLKNIYLLLNHGINVKISSPMVLGLDDIKGLYYFAKKMNLRWSSDPTISSSFDKRDGVELLKNDKAVLRKYVDFMISEKLFSIESLKKENSTICGLGEKTIHVNNNGDCFFCSSFPLPFGNCLKEKNVILKKKIENYRKMIIDNSSCRGCEMLSFCSPCPALSLLEDGDVLRCSSSRKKYAEVLKEIYEEY